MTQTLADLLSARYSRRQLLKGAAAGVAALSLPLPARAASTTSLTFTPIARGVSDTHQVAEGYEVQTLLRWGDPLKADLTPFNPYRLTPEEQAQRFGYNCDYVAYFPLKNNRALLCVNHEYPMRPMMFSGHKEIDPIVAAKVEMESVGVSVVEISQDESGYWRSHPNSSYNRRITSTTPIQISGSAAGHVRLKTSGDPEGRTVLGTYANCAGGVTPWGTYLSAEENFDMSFGGSLEKHHSEYRNYRRLGLGKKDYNNWKATELRFDLGKEPNEANRFGWIVEIDPHDPKSMPIKRTALGRFKHECATCTQTNDGRVVVYSGDDEAFEYLYKFVSSEPVQPGGYTANRDRLDNGTLYVARLYEDGRLRWLPLVYGTSPLTEINGFHSQADVLIEARHAAMLLGATPMDRPEDVETNPANGHVYVALSNNRERKEKGIASPSAPNTHGHILELIPDGGDHGSETFEWHLFLKGSAEGVSCPDNVAFDNTGNVWIATDGMEKTAGVADALYAMPADGQTSPKRFFSVPRAAEVTGPVFAPDNRSLFVAVQHPGAEGNSTFENPTTRWPDFDKAMPPRPSVVVIRKKDGGVIGT